MQNKSLFMKPIKIGVIIESIINEGGGYQQALNAALLVKYISQKKCDPVFITLHKQNIYPLKKYGIDAHHLKLSGISKLFLRLKSSFVHPKILSQGNDPK